MIYSDHNEDAHPLERAHQHIEAAFNIICHFLRMRKNTPLYGAELEQMHQLALHFYNRYSSTMQFHGHYSGKPLDEVDILPLKIKL